MYITSINSCLDCVNILECIVMLLGDCRLDVDYHHLSQRLDEHESKHSQLQHYIQMVSTVLVQVSHTKNCGMFFSPLKKCSLLIDISDGFLF